MPIRTLSALLLAATLLHLPSHAAATDNGNPAPVEPASTMVFQLHPGADARYTDPDTATHGAANPAWKPGNPRHLRIAREAARRAKASPRDAARYAYLLGLRGEYREALVELAIAKQRFPGASEVHWSEGWILLTLGDHAAALHAWQQAQTLHGGQPYWVPYSKAVALTGLGEIDAALAWWSVAQRSLTPHLDTAGKARRYFWYWRAPERALLERLLAAHAHQSAAKQATPAGR